jgi:hypothetical protein
VHRLLNIVLMPPVAACVKLIAICPPELKKYLALSPVLNVIVNLNVMLLRQADVVNLVEVD